MPIYSYVCKSGHLTDRNYSMDNARRTVKCSECKGRAKRVYSLVSGFRPPSCWPLLSNSMGVLPEQIPEAVQDAKNRGVPTQFDPEGPAIFENRSHRRKFLKAYEAHDKDACYGDD